MDVLTPHQKYLRFANAMVGLEGRSVLEVGGCSPVRDLQRYAPAKWDCVDLTPVAVDAFNEEAAKLGSEKYRARLQDIAQLQPSQSFDLVYSINSFEHILQLETALDRMYDALRDGGYLFTLFGPIWSCDVGHHLSVKNDNGGDLTFNDGVLGPWEHLVSSREQIRSRLSAKYGESTAERAVTYIYDYPDLNRFVESDYIELFGRSRFSEVLLLKRRHGRAPSVPGATNTREMLVLFKKGRPGALESVTAKLRFGLTYLASRISSE